MRTSVCVASKTHDAGCQCRSEMLTSLLGIVFEDPRATAPDLSVFIASVRCFKAIDQLFKTTHAGRTSDTSGIRRSDSRTPVKHYLFSYGYHQSIARAGSVLVGSSTARRLWPEHGLCAAVSMVFWSPV